MGDIQNATCNSVTITEDDLKKLRTLEQLADSNLSFNIRDFFSRSTLLCYLWRCRGKLSPEKMLSKLEDAVKVREEIHELERKMDKEYFHWLVADKDFFTTSGFQKGTDNRVFWFRGALFVKGIWSLQAGTPRACAFARAWIYFYELANVQARLMPGRRVVYVCDRSGKGLLDFNIKLTWQVLRIISRLFFIDNESFEIFGNAKFASQVINQVKLLSGERAGNMHFRAKDENPQDLLEDPADTPELWLRDRWGAGAKAARGKPRSGEDRRNVWLIERVMTDNDDERLTTADVYNCGEWPFEEYAGKFSGGNAATSGVFKESYSGLLSACSSHNALDPFDPDEEDDW